MGKGKRIRRDRPKTVESLEMGLSRLGVARNYAADAIPKYEAKIEKAKARVEMLDGKITAQKDAIKEAERKARENGMPKSQVPEAVAA